MALDLYVGTLTHYYAGELEPGQSKVEGAPSLSEVRRAVLVWRDGLSLGLQAHLEDPLDWDESASAPCFRERLGWEAYAGIVLWAAYAEHPELPRPAAPALEWESDPAWQASNAQGFASRYGQLLYGPELWLPCPFGFTFRAADAWDDEITTGSSLALLAELEALNAATWGADAAAVKAWRRAGLLQGEATLEACARFGFSIFVELAQRAVAHALPMVLDFGEGSGG